MNGVFLKAKNFNFKYLLLKKKFSIKLKIPKIFFLVKKPRFSKFSSPNDR